MELAHYLQISAAQHSHLCPRQVLGVRMALAGLRALDMKCPPPRRRLLIISETDGCFCDGLIAVSGCTVGHRNLRIVDYGKVAASFVDLETELAIRIAPQKDIRQKAHRYAPEEQKAYFAQLVGYGRMPDAELFTFQVVQLEPSAQALISRSGLRVHCSVCGEEILNEREVRIGEQVLCRACAGQAYYQQPAPFAFTALSISAADVDMESQYLSEQ